MDWTDFLQRLRALPDLRYLELHFARFFELEDIHRFLDILCALPNLQDLQIHCGVACDRPDGLPQRFCIQPCSAKDGGNGWISADLKNDLPRWRDDLHECICSQLELALQEASLVDTDTES